MCSETVVSDMRQVSKLLVPRFGRPDFLCQDRMIQARGIAAYVRDGYGAFHKPSFEYGCCEMFVFMVCGVKQNFYVFSLYRNPDVDGRIYDCLLTSMAAVQAEDVSASIMFVGDLSDYHQGSLGSTAKNRHGSAAFTIATASGCDRLVVFPIHARGGTLDLLITDVLNLIRVAAVVPVINSDQSALSAVISPCGLGIRIQPTFALVRVVRVD